MLNPISPTRDLVLVGGGHSHVLVMKKLAMSALSDLRVTLISPAAFTPYSGMLPGLLAGHYSFEETHIDLMRFCQWAGIRFLVDTVESLDPDARTLHCRSRGVVSYDLLSIDIGSSPELDSVPGAREFAIPVKPVAELWNRWESLSRQDNLAGRRIAIVGGGAGSVEIALAIAHHLGRQQPDLALYCGSEEVLPGYSKGARKRVVEQLNKLGVVLHCSHRVRRVTESQLQFESPDSSDSDNANFDNANFDNADYESLIWCTGAAAAPWIKESGLPVDERGFMQVEDTLQSTGYENVFGAGDIATQYRHPRPKAGVYAVRQGPVLAENLLAYHAGESLREHKPQSEFLSMLALGPQRAVAQRNGLSVSGAWVWRWKDRIDREFMARFRDLAPRQMDSAKPRTASDDKTQAPCGGCGAKVSGDALHAVLAELRAMYPELLPAAGCLDDAMPVRSDGPLLQSLDALRGLVDDPWRMGRIAAQHALSDLYAVGAKPHSAQALVTLPFAAPALLRRDLLMVLQGALSVFDEVGCTLDGGHSMQGPELQLGFAVNGVLAAGDAPLPKRGAQPGDTLLLSKTLGSGALFAAHMQGLADGRHVDDALHALEQGNGAAAKIARDYQARAVTDVTGFGLAGHLLEMLGDTLAADIELGKLKITDGALDAMTAGVFSTLHEPNRQAIVARWAPPEDLPLLAELLFDPQTSGGLLMAMPPEKAAQACEALHAQAVEAELIGTLRSAGPGVPALRIS
ncbi:selenide, water dikinase SelD [Congregibacter litoralis]|uniref:Selenophosphate synthase n=1 Tax=Congregibacter litoralis KT71 TaxID=314285 RepID=A4A8V3_9GAMM|nr:selenide, water dikinase SelD [Congregibacter litoralis]EAQ97495.1 selenophosphate synthase [Congregibacter litoralis KT71]